MSRMISLSLFLLGCPTKTDGTTTADSGTTSTTDTDTDTDTTPMGPYTITVSATDVAGYNGKILLAFATDKSGPLGAFCEALTTDPATISGEVREILADPCTVGDPIDFPAGTYDISAGIYIGGKKTPEACAATTATVVDGPVEVALPAFGPCP